MRHFARRLKVQDNINTDYVISGRYKFKIQDPRELEVVFIRKIRDEKKFKTIDSLVENIRKDAAEARAILR